MTDNLQVSQKKEESKSVNLLSLNVVRRDGSISPFKSDKISEAIKKAFLAQTKIRNNKNKDKEQQDSIYKTVEILTHKVVSALTRRIADGDMIHIEDIQDQVELALMRDEHHKVARAYVLYREQRAASRYHTNKLKEQVGVKVSSLMVLKRDGTKEPVSLDKITNRVSVLSTGLNIDPIVVAQKAIPGLYPDITSTEIDNYLAETAAALTVEHPDYSYLAARIKANSLHKETPGLGGEIVNPRWKAIWKGKEVYSDTGDVVISVIKGSVDKSSKKAKYQVDGLSGATITSNGVTNLLSFWLGEMGYGPLIEELKSKESIDV